MEKYEFEKRTLGYALEDKARSIGDKILLLHEDLKVTYEEMNENANRVANSFLNLGIEKGDKVCMVMTNSVEFHYVRFALAKIGAVMVPINVALKGDLLRYIIDNADASVIIVDSDLLDRIVFIQEEIKKIKNIILVPEASNGVKEFSQNFSIKNFTELYGGSPKDPACDVRFYDPMSILYTSGTTGPSKGAILSHAHHYSVAYQESQYGRYTEDSVVYSCLPFFHANAATAFQGTILAGGTFAMGKRFSLTTFWDEIKSYGATHTNVLGSIFPLLARQPAKEDDADNTLKVMNAVPWLPEFEEFEKRFDLKLITMYGLTESGIVIVSPFEEKIRPGSCGKPIEVYDVKIVDDYDIECAPNTTGEIVARGKEPYTQMDGYYNNPEATASAFRNLWFHTGDYAYKDEDGYFYFVDRKKDVIKPKGENVAAAEIERVLNENDKILESYAIGIPDTEGLWGERIKVFLVLRENETMELEEMQDWCKAKLADFKIPSFMEVVQEADLPRTAVGKVKKNVLKANEVEL